MCPQLAELEDILSEKEELKQLAARYGGDIEITDEDIDKASREDDVDEESAEPPQDEAEQLAEEEEAEPSSAPDGDDDAPAGSSEHDGGDEPLRSRAADGGAD